jgi:DNA-binding NtrC family response regulator
MADILIVEDGVIERERLQNLFSSAGYSVRTADNFDSADRLLSVEACRLCILDIGLSDRSGSLLFEKFNSLKQRPIVIVLTGNPSVHLKRSLIEQGASDFIVKASPQAENDRLLENVRSKLGDPRPQATSKSAIALPDFIKNFVMEKSKELFLNSNLEVAECISCGGTNIEVTFSHKLQVPPVVEGLIRCSDCGAVYDPEVS